LFVVVVVIIMDDENSDVTLMLTMLLVLSAQDSNVNCNSAPCQNGGSCYSTNNGQYVCSCLNGFAGINCQTREYK
jgi:hypothetical protein